MHEHSLGTERFCTRQSLRGNVHFFSARNEMTSSVCVGSKNQKQELYEYIMCPHCFDTKY
jgi:hypothetical protein